MKKLFIILLALVPAVAFAQDAKIKGSVETLNQLGIGPKNDVTFGSVTVTNAATTRTSLGLATNSAVTFGSVTTTNTDLTRSNLGFVAVTNAAVTNSVWINSVRLTNGTNIYLLPAIKQ